MRTLPGSQSQRRRHHSRNGAPEPVLASTGKDSLRMLVLSQSRPSQLIRQDDKIVLEGSTYNFIFPYFADEVLKD